MSAEIERCFHCECTEEHPSAYGYWKCQTLKRDAAIQGDPCKIAVLERQLTQKEAEFAEFAALYTDLENHFVWAKDKLEQKEAECAKITLERDQLASCLPQNQEWFETMHAIVTGKDEPYQGEPKCCLCGLGCNTQRTAIFGIPGDQNPREPGKNGMAHIYCSHTLRGAKISEQERKIAALESALREHEAKITRLENGITWAMESADFGVGDMLSRLRLVLADRKIKTLEQNETPAPPDFSSARQE